MKKYLRFLEIRTKPTEYSLTKIWQVINEKEWVTGLIKWHSAWRRYVFEPNMDTFFDATCLREIANFIEARMKERGMRR